MKDETVIELIPANNTTTALLHTIINLGTVIDKTRGEQQDAPLNVKTAMNIFLKNILLATSDYTNPDSIAEWVEEYAKMYMLNALGVKDYPLILLKGGGIEGICSKLDEVEINIDKPF